MNLKLTKLKTKIGVTLFFGAFLLTTKTQAQTGAALNFQPHFCGAFCATTYDVARVSGTAIATTLDPLNTITVEAWIKPETNTGLGVIVGNYSTSGVGMQFLLRRDNNNYTFWVDDGTGFKVVTSLAPITIGVYQHVAGVWNGSDLKIYINGVLDNTTTGVTGLNFATTINEVWLGNNNSEPYQGTIDEVRIWTRALCVAEIRNNMNSEVTATGNGLIANYHFNQGIAGGGNGGVTSLTDASGNGYSATLSYFTLSGGNSNWVSPGGVTTGVTASPMISVVGTNTICSGGPTTLTAGSIAYTTYTWTAGPNTSTFVVTPTVNTTYSVAATHSLGCVYFATKTVSVIAKPTISVTSGAICSGNSFTMVPSGASTYSYTGGSAVVTPTANMSYSVTGTSSVGCVSSNTAISSVTVNAKPTISVTSGSICSGNSFTMVPSGASTYSYTGGSAVVTPTANMSYSVTGTSSVGCVSSNTAVSTVTVNANPTISASASSTVICAGEATTLSATASSATYTWNTGATTASLSVSPTTTTNYTVTTTGTNGCIGTANVNVMVNVCTDIATVSNNDATTNVYPNPNKGLFIIELAITAQVEITNSLGQLVISKKLEIGKHNIDIHSEATGIYFVRVITNNKQQVIKLIKE